MQACQRTGKTRDCIGHDPIAESRVALRVLIGIDQQFVHLSGQTLDHVSGHGAAVEFLQAFVSPAHATPETTGRTHYWYWSTRNFAIDPQANAAIKPMVEFAFAQQDKPMLEAQQRRIGAAAAGQHGSQGERGQYDRGRQNRASLEESSHRNLHLATASGATIQPSIAPPISQGLARAGGTMLDRPYSERRSSSENTLRMRNTSAGLASNR